MPLRQLVVLDEAHVDDAGVVDQNVDTAELVDRDGDHTLPVVGSGDVEMFVAGSVANLLGDHFALGIEDVAENYLGSLVHECPNVRGAHPAGAATYHGNLARQPSCHRCLRFQQHWVLLGTT